MSHRVTIETNITDGDAAKAALDNKGWKYSTIGDHALRVESGPMDGATINLRTGQVIGDTDYHRGSQSSLGALNQAYTEAIVRKEIASQGGWVESCITEANGDLVLVGAGLSLA